MSLLIFIYCMMGMLICKYEPLWQEVCAESYTQVTNKDGWSLFSNFVFFSLKSSNTTLFFELKRFF